MSSMNTTTNLSNSGMNTEFIRYMKCVGAFVNPNDEILIKPVSHRESRLGDIFITDFNLMIAGAKINLGEHLGSCQLIKQDIDAWEGILVLDGDCIQRSVIHTQTETFIFL
jgi:hypothetical protein